MKGLKQIWQIIGETIFLIFLFLFFMFPWKLIIGSIFIYIFIRTVFGYLKYFIEILIAILGLEKKDDDRR